MTTPAQARHDAGLSLEKAAKRARVCPTYLRRIEKHGDTPYILATRLAALYQCRVDVFLQGQPRRPKRSRLGRNPTGSKIHQTSRVEE